MKIGQIIFISFFIFGFNEFADAAKNKIKKTKPVSSEQMINDELNELDKEFNQGAIKADLPPPTPKKKNKEVAKVPVKESAKEYAKVTEKERSALVVSEPKQLVMSQDKKHDTNDRKSAAIDPKNFLIIGGSDLLSAEEAEVQKNIKLKLVPGQRDEEPLRVQSQLSAVVTKDNADVVNEAEEEPED